MKFESLKFENRKAITENRKQITERLSWPSFCFLLSVFCYCLSPFCFAFEPPVAYFSGQDHIDQQIIALMDHSRQKMDMALYEFSSRPLEEALARASQRGVHVRLVLDPHIATEKKTVAGLEKIPNLSLRYSGSRRGKKGHMHHKFLVVDGETMVTGSYNWTPGAEYVNYEDILVEKDAGLVVRYEQEFERLWSVGEDSTLLPLSRTSAFKSAGHRKKRKRN